MGVLKIYGDRRSGNCLKVRWTARMLGVEHEWIEIDVVAGGTRTEEFLKVNPSGQAPAMVLPDGRLLSQSNAMVKYLAALRGSALVPDDNYERAKVDEWLFWEQYSHEPYIAVRRYQKKFLGKHDDEIDPALLTKGRRALARLELQLGETPFLVGDAMTAADIALVAYTRVAHEGGFSLDDFTAVRAWLARVERTLAIDTKEDAA